MKNWDLQGQGGGTMAAARVSRWGAIVLGLVTLLGVPGVVRAGKLSWLDDVVHEVIVEAKAGGKGLVREVGGDGARAEVRRAGRLFLSHEADEGLEHLIRQSDELARAGRRIDRPAEALLEEPVFPIAPARPADPPYLRGTPAGRETAGCRAR